MGEALLGFDNTSSTKNTKRSVSTAGLDHFNNFSTNNFSTLPESLTSDEIKQILDKSDEVIIDQINANNIKRVVAQFEKRCKKNQENRIKFQDDPEKWIKSEVDLDEEIKKLKQLAALPELYETAISLGLIPMLLGQLNHINTDIAIEVLDVLSELTEPDTVAESSCAELFIDQLITAQLPELIAENIIRINEEQSNEDFQAITNALEIIENLVDLRPTFCNNFIQLPKFFKWLLRRIRPQSIVDYNRVYASEILSILLQNSTNLNELFDTHTSSEIIEKLLRAIAFYRKRDPSNSEEEELVQNLFDCLCNLMLIPKCQLSFAKAQGLELMIRMMKERKLMCGLAVRLTNFAISDCPSNCQIFVEKMGLKSVFSMFMNKGLTLKRGSTEETQLEEHLSSIIQSLCQNCVSTPLARVINKFTEEGFEKLERLLELHETYQYRMNSTHISSTRKKEAAAINQEMQIDEEEQRYLDKCEQGLFVLQQVDTIIVRLTNMGNSPICQRIFILLRNKGISTQQVIDNVYDYQQSLDKSMESEKKVLGECLENFSTMISEMSEAFEQEI